MTTPQLVTPVWDVASRNWHDLTPDADDLLASYGPDVAEGRMTSDAAVALAVAYSRSQREAADASKAGA